MTLEKQCSEFISITAALEFDAVSWESLTDEQVTKVFESTLSVTRPEYARRDSGGKSAIAYISPEQKVMFADVKSKAGIDLAEMMKNLGIKGKKK